MEKFHFFDTDKIVIRNNPRTFSNPGFSKEKMDELRASIAEDGLKLPLEVRIVDKEIVLIAGERRLRSIQSLIESDEEVFDRNHNKRDKASKVYKQVKCIITECATDKDAARAAVLENLLHEHLTDYELLLQCDTLELTGHTRQEQAKIFGKSEAWVSQSHALIKGSPKVLDALATGVLGRTQALQFLNYPPHKTEAIIERAIKYNKMDWEEKEKELQQEHSQLVSDIEELEGKMSAQQALDEEDEAISTHREIVEKEKEIDSVEKKIKKHRSSGSRKPRPSIANIQNAAQDEDASGGPTRHTPMKQVKKWADKLQELLDSNEPLINPETEEEYPRDKVKLIGLVLNCVLARNNLKSPLDAIALAKE